MAFLSVDALAYRHVLEHLVETSRAPSACESAAALGLTRREVAASLRRLETLRVLVLEKGKASIEMAPPFSAVATPHVVTDGEREWFASCAWEALGLLPLLERDGSIRSICPDCDESIILEVGGGEVAGEAIFHIAVPARRWWDDIRFT